jgi:ferritin
MGYHGFAKWFEQQAGEELLHATKIASYLVEVGAIVKLPVLDAPKADYKSVKEVVETALNHEKHITKCINECIDVAAKNSDRASENFLMWFVDEQVEEVVTAQKLLAMVDAAGESKIHLFMLEGRIFSLREGSKG